jgi:ribosomal protein S18 acetylase RimI-like enzyme
MAEIRQARIDDLDAVYRIALLTGDSGMDASALHRDGKLIGHVYAAPYVALSADTSLVVEDAEGVAGYLVGTYDTLAFAERLEREWWPKLRQAYPDPQGETSDWSADERYMSLFHHPNPPPHKVAGIFPAHIHMNLLPRLRGQGMGSKLLARWMADAKGNGVTGIHLGASPENAGGIAFWTSRGFRPLTQPLVDENDETAWFGQHI